MGTDVFASPKSITIKVIPRHPVVMVLFKLVLVASLATLTVASPGSNQWQKPDPSGTGVAHQGKPSGSAGGPEHSAWQHTGDGGNTNHAKPTGTDASAGKHGKPQRRNAAKSGGAPAPATGEHGGKHRDDMEKPSGNDHDDDKHGKPARRDALKGRWPGDNGKYSSKPKRDMMSSGDAPEHGDGNHPEQGDHKKPDGKDSKPEPRDAAASGGATAAGGQEHGSGPHTGKGDHNKPTGKHHKPGPREAATGVQNWDTPLGTGSVAGAVSAWTKAGDSSQGSGSGHQTGEGHHAMPTGDQHGAGGHGQPKPRAWTEKGGATAENAPHGKPSGAPTSGDSESQEHSGSHPSGNAQGADDSNNMPGSKGEDGSQHNPHHARDEGPKPWYRGFGKGKGDNPSQHDSTDDEKDSNRHKQPQTRDISDENPGLDELRRIANGTESGEGQNLDARDPSVVPVYGVYECKNRDFKGPCTWTKVSSSQQCINSPWNDNNKGQGSIGPDKGLCCIVYDVKDCNAKGWIAMDGLHWPGIGNYGTSHFLAVGAMSDEGISSYKCRLLDQEDCKGTGANKPKDA